MTSTLYSMNVNEAKRWNNRIITAGIVCFLLHLSSLINAATPDTSALHNKMPSHNWEILFNGTNTAKWRGVKSDTFPAGWHIEQGSLVLARAGSGDIITREKYTNFDFVFEFQLTVPGNSGIK